MWQDRHAALQPPFPDQLLQSYDADALFASVYALARWTPNERVTLAPGMIDHRSLADGTSASPWVQGRCG